MNSHIATTIYPRRKPNWVVFKMFFVVILLSLGAWLFAFYVKPESLGAPVPVRVGTRTIQNSIGMQLAYIPLGHYQMGSSPPEPGHYDDEAPRHEVEFTSCIYMGVFEVTQDEYQAIVRSNPSAFQSGGKEDVIVKGIDTRRFPVERVSYGDAISFCKKLSSLPKEKASGRRYRLPTEAEWEYACRAGSTLPFHFGNKLTVRQANFDGSDSLPFIQNRIPVKRPVRVGSYSPNKFGLYDMHGNVAEWCSDWYHDNYYSVSPKKDPRGPAKGSLRVARGGCWSRGDWACRSSYRTRTHPDLVYSYLGFRVACDLIGPQR